MISYRIKQKTIVGVNKHSTYEVNESHWSFLELKRILIIQTTMLKLLAYCLYYPQD